MTDMFPPSASLAADEPRRRLDLSEAQEPFDTGLPCNLLLARAGIDSSCPDGSECSYCTQLAGVERTAEDHLRV